MVVYLSPGVDLSHLFFTFDAYFLLWMQFKNKDHSEIFASHLARHDPDRASLMEEM